MTDWEVSEAYWERQRGCPTPPCIPCPFLYSSSDEDPYVLPRAPPPSPVDEEEDPHVLPRAPPPSPVDEEEDPHVLSRAPPPSPVEEDDLKETPVQDISSANIFYHMSHFSMGW